MHAPSTTSTSTSTTTTNTENEARERRRRTYLLVVAVFCGLIIAIGLPAAAVAVVRLKRRDAELDEDLQTTPEDEDELIAKAAGNQYNLAKMKKHNDGVMMELRQWQDVMFETGLPDYIIGTIHVNNDPFLCIKSLRLLNLILMNSTE